MGIFNRHSYTPYTNFHEMNLDWILDKIKALEEYVTTSIETEIRRIMSRAFVDTVYDEKTRTITFKFEVK